MLLLLWLQRHEDIQSQHLPFVFLHAKQCKSKHPASYQPAETLAHLVPVNPVPLQLPAVSIGLQQPSTIPCSTVKHITAVLGDPGARSHINKPVR
jgi:hypothetical protein